MPSDELIVFTIEGSAERNGNVTAETFIAKLRQFVTTVYAFERAFTRRERRNIDLEVVELSRSNPTNVKFKHRSRELGYHSEPAIKWTFEQIDRVHKGEPIDEHIPQSAIDNVIELAKHRGKGERDFRILRVEYDEKSVSFDTAMEAHALALRSTRQTERKHLWHSGVSKGSLFGELRGVMDFDGERRFYIVPPSGPNQVECVFPENLREQMNAHLFKLVRVEGYLRYDGETAFPYLLDAERLTGVTETHEHFSDLRGIFRDLDRPDASEMLYQ